MKESRLRVLLSQLANFGRFLTVYPLLLFCYTGILKQQNALLAGWDAAAAIAMAYISMGATLLCLRHFQRVLGVRLVQALILAVSAMVGVLLRRALGGTGWMCMYAGILFALYSVMGSLSATIPLKRWEFFVAAGVYLFTVIVLSLRGFGYPITAFLIQFLLVAGTFALEYNFQNIDFLMHRRGHRMSHLPGRIRAFNLLLLLGGMVLVLVLVLSRDFFMQIAGVVFRAVGAVLYFLATPLRRWWNNDDFWDREIDMPEPGWEADPDDAFEQLTEYEEKPVDTEMQADLLAGLAIAVVAFVLIRYHRQIFEAIGAVWNWLRQKLSGLFRRLGTRNRVREDENEYYTDVEQQIGDAEQTEATVSDLRTWRKRLRAYQKLPDGREKYLTGFALTADGLKLHGVSVLPSDTPLELLEKSRGILEPEAYRVAVQSCNALAFSTHEEVPAWMQLHAALEILRTRKSLK